MYTLSENTPRNVSCLQAPSASVLNTKRACAVINKAAISSGEPLPLLSSSSSFAIRSSAPTSSPSASRPAAERVLATRVAAKSFAFINFRFARFSFSARTAALCSRCCLDRSLFFVFGQYESTYSAGGGSALVLLTSIRT